MCLHSRVWGEAAETSRNAESLYSRIAAELSGGFSNHRRFTENDDSQVEHILSFY